MSVTPANFRIDTSGMSPQLIGTLHHAEFEWAAVLVIRWHHLRGLANEWAAVSGSELVALADSDREGVGRWAKNPFWRPDLVGFRDAGYVTGWGNPDEPGKLTQKFFDAVEAVWARLRGGTTS